MKILGNAIRHTIQLGKTPDYPTQHPADRQKQQLLHLLKTAQHTAFGRFYGFNELIFSPDPVRNFQKNIPATDYNTLYERWWSQAHLCDTPDVTWPGTIPYYALSSGTSQAATKYIPVTQELLRGMKKGTRRMFFDLAKYNLPADLFTRQMLMIGSSTDVKPEGRHQTGDLSGIMGLNRPLWMSRYYRPGRTITNITDWNERIDAIAASARQWDIGFAVGNPAWMQLVLEAVIKHHNVQHIHEIWPNLSIYVHSGVLFEPYRPTFERLLGQPVATIDSYMASEGFFAYQNRPNVQSMRLLTDCGVFFEFVPFNEANFDENGDLLSTHPTSYTLEEVQEDQDYAMLISSCAGAWRYLLGDTVRFTNTRTGDIRITGRTKQFLSVCGEHLSIDNLNAAVCIADQELRAGVREYTVAGLREGDSWAHQWWISMENSNVSVDAFVAVVDRELCNLNDDYRTERAFALKTIKAEIVPNNVFFEWLGSKGKMNGQAKIPRVLKGKQLDDFQQFMHSRAHITV